MQTSNHFWLKQTIISDFYYNITINIARIANAVQCHSWLSGNKDCNEFRFSIVRILISVSVVTSLQDFFFKIVKFVNNCQNCQKNSQNSYRVIFWVRSCLLFTLMKCLKGHKSLGSLGSVLCMSKVKVPSVSEWLSDWVSQWVTRSPIELFWTAKNLTSLHLIGPI